ncbi:protein DETOXIFICATION 56-like [Manihot esculenta]|uniref:protein DETOXIFICATION 56-like n=1 Tax=Manihot esculenta TaxID=3983 RepID=UPI000B5D142D|nr:protein DETOXIFICATION 56-like [Manihot esculenta]
MNLTWFAKIVVTTAFLGHLGELRLAGGSLGFTFANVTGFSVLNGICGAMEPICGQPYGAKNFRLLHKTLLMTIFLLLLITLPASFLWLNVEKILIHLGQQEEISLVAKTHLLITSLLCPLKSYLSAQGKRQGREVEGGRMVRPKRWRLVEVAKALWTVLNRSSAHRKRVRLIMDTIANLSLFLEMIVYIQE